MHDTKLYDPKRDFRQVSFKINLNNQNFELAILSIVANDQMFFYAIFKPDEYDHIIHISPPSLSWTETVNSFSTIFNEVCNYFNVQPESHNEIVNFISNKK